MFETQILYVQRSTKLKPIAEQDANGVIIVETTIEVKKFAKALRDKERLLTLSRSALANFFTSIVVSTVMTSSASCSAIGFRQLPNPTSAKLSEMETLKLAKTYLFFEKKNCIIMETSRIYPGTFKHINTHHKKTLEVAGILARMSKYERRTALSKPEENKGNNPIQLRATASIPDLAPAPPVTQ
ncbi:hypothetical protein L5515_019253 [Caenorhabditis briggsae]|uniref:Uncharacterized protein n=1 Tax=Caenorhabditis briggsae TaxID=6238 RepID=A0AAE9JTG9_CAEBR|nr:hypothetical protein L5515_019253 [Caenorhabditis briggsae]